MLINLVIAHYLSLRYGVVFSVIDTKPGTPQFLGHSFKGDKQSDMETKPALLDLFRGSSTNGHATLFDVHH
jgi:hypothetical protein